MTDIATLGIKIDSSQASGASGVLDHLAAIARNTANTVSLLERAANTAATAATGLDRASKGASTSIDAVGKAAGGSKSLLEGFAAALDSAVGSVRDMTSVGQRGLDEMRAKFDPLYAAGQKYKQTLNDIRDAHRAGALTEKQMAAAITDAKVAFVEQTNTIRGVSGAYDTHARSINLNVSGNKALAASTGLARHEMINLSRQIQDIGVSLVSGQSPFLVIAQQGAQVVDIYGSSKTGTVGGSIKQIGSAIASVLTPARLLAGGVAAAGAIAYVAYGQWKSFALGLDDAAKQAGVLSSEMAKLQAVASFKGIASDEFTKGIGNFSQQVYLSKTNAGGLLEVFRANGVAARDFTGSMEKAADLIKNAASDQQRLVLLQQMGLPATMEWVRLMSGGAEGLRRMKTETSEFGGIMHEQMVLKARQFDEAWNRGWTNFGLSARGAIVTAAGLLDTLIQKGRQGAMAIGFEVGPNMLRSGLGTSLGTNFDDFYKSTGAPNGAAPKPTVDPAALQRQIALEQQRIGLLGQLATAADAERSVELQVQQARLNGVSITGAQVEALKRLASEQTLGISGIKAATDAWNVETATVGMGVGQATAYASAQSAINAAKQQGRELTAGNIAAIHAEASALGAAAQNADNMRFVYTNLVQGPMQAFRSALSQGATAMDALKKAGTSALDAISTKLMDMAAQNLWKAAFPSGSSSGIGGFISSLFGGGSGGAAGSMAIGGQTFTAFGAHSGMGPGDAPTFTRNIHPAYFDDAPRYHSGIGPGEQAAIIRKDESVLTPGQMKALAPVGSGGGVTIVQHNTFTNADPGSEARMRQALAQTKDMAVKEAVQAVATIKGAAPSYMRASR